VIRGGAAAVIQEAGMFSIALLDTAHHRDQCRTIHK
jgi:hypothetical protein